MARRSIREPDLEHARAHVERGGDCREGKALFPPEVLLGSVYTRLGYRAAWPIDDGVEDEIADEPDVVSFFRLTSSRRLIC